MELAIEVRDPNGKPFTPRHRNSRRGRGRKKLPRLKLPRRRLWSPKSPALYSCTVTLKSPHGEQQVTEKFGVRSFEWVEHGPFKLNGERLLLRGTPYHEDHAGVGAAVPDDVVRKTFQQIKDMGANFVRLGHYQQAPLVLEMCDQLGLLVWEEIPWCRGGLGGERYQQQCRDMLHNMIDQHYNHPSVILWGLGNENDWPGDFETFNTNAIRAFMTELNTLAHQLDPSRKTCIRRCDFCKDIVDVYSPSIWAGWYSGRYTEYRASSEKEIKAAPQILPRGVGRRQPRAASFGRPGEISCDRSPPAKAPRKSASVQADRRQAARVTRWRLVGELHRQSLRLASQGTGADDESDRRGAMDFQRLFHAAAPGKSHSESESERRRRARRHAEGRLLRFPKLLGRQADDSHLRTHLARALGQSRTRRNW